MENSHAAIAALLFIVLIVGINVMMYGIVRGIMRGGKNGPFETMMRAFDPARKKRDDEFEELRRSVGGLTGDGDENQKSGDF
ncbi:MAG: hypothetical protein IPG44_03895 [Anaerolineales bacterium]|jgi:hypothetical protein|nr:hypothetical protein [Chloroflexota bacterium]MBK6644887.1 hypothetical protein [Anaerolineales bacterium]